MDIKARIRQAIESGGGSPDPDVLEELTHHATGVYESARAEGLADDEIAQRVDDVIATWRDEARGLKARRTRATAGALIPTRESRWSLPLLPDLRAALRVLRREPGFALLAVATNALGIAAVTTLLGVVNGVLLRPLPWPDSERLLRLEERRDGRIGRIPWTITNGTYHAWADSPQTIDAIGAWRAGPRTLTGRGEPRRIQVGEMTPSLVSLLAVAPVRGRSFGSADVSAPAGLDAAVLSDHFWRTEFGGDDSALGASLDLNGRLYVVTGIMPADFSLPEAEADVWVPMAVATVRLPPGPDGTERGIVVQVFRAMVKARAGMTPEQVSAEGAARVQSGGAPSVLFGGDGSVELRARPALEVTTADVRPALWLLMAAGVLLLLTSTASVAGVHLARAARRKQEFAIRTAIGASSRHLVKQAIAESTVLAAVAGLAGWMLAVWLLQLLPGFLPAGFPRVSEIRPDLVVALAAIAVAWCASLVSSFPAVTQAIRVRVVEVLSGGAPGSSGGTFRTPIARLRGLLMAGEVAVATVLLIGMTLVGRSFVALINADRGYDPANVLTLRLVLPRGATIERDGAALEQLEEQVRSMPGVTHAALSNALPFVSGPLRTVTMTSSADPGNTVVMSALNRVVSPGFFQAMRLRVVDGRPLESTDIAPASSRALVVNRSFASKYLGNSPVGQQLQLSIGLNNKDWVVVGVVEDMQQGGLEGGTPAMFGGLTDPAQPETFSTLRQSVGPLQDGVFLLARTEDDASSLAPAVRGLIRREMPNAVIDSVVAMDDRVMKSLARPRLYAMVLAGLAVFALGIAGVGLFGVLAYTTAQRTREIGIRTALGAERRDVVGLVVRQAMTIVMVGLIVGCVAGAAGAQVISSMIYGVPPHDVLSFAAAALVILTVALMACVVPARRAASVDPVRALRQ